MYVQLNEGFPFYSTRMFPSFSNMLLDCQVSNPSTTYIGQVMAEETGEDPDVDTAARTGNLAMLLFSIVATAAGAVLPQLTNRNPRLLDASEDVNEEAEYLRVQRTLSDWKGEAEARGKSFELPTLPYTLRDVWCFALVLYGIISLWTFFINTVTMVSMPLRIYFVCLRSLTSGDHCCIVDRNLLGSCSMGSFCYDYGSMSLPYLVFSLIDKMISFSFSKSLQNSHLPLDMSDNHSRTFLSVLHFLAKRLLTRPPTCATRPEELF